MQSANDHEGNDPAAGIITLAAHPARHDEATHDEVAAARRSLTTALRRADACSDTGPAPPAWGQPHMRPGHGWGHRTISACAGQSHSRPVSRSVTRDHPRMHGTDIVRQSKLDWIKEASPHARGRRPQRLRAAAAGRIIPECAGPTGVMTRLRPGRRDHPRMRGADPGWAAEQAFQTGLSPHARGRRSDLGLGVVSTRTIPACAGLT